MKPLATFVICESRWPIGGADRLGTVEARDRRHAREVALAQWPNVGLLIVQPVTDVMLAMDHEPRRKPRDFALISRINRVRRKGR